MNRITFTILAIIISITLSAQEWQKYLPHERDKTTALNLSDYQQAFKRWCDDYGVDQDGYFYVNGKKEKLGGYKQFKRWELHMLSQVDAGTMRFPQTDVKAEWEKYLREYPEASRSTYGSWTGLGPSTTPGGKEGLGRLNHIAFHPSDPNTFWVSAPTGGLWKTTDHGAAWTCLTDFLENIGASDIIIPDNYATSQTIYLATGDRDTHRKASLGVLKSTDGGTTWDETDLTWDSWTSEYVNRMLKHPTLDNTIYVATTLGLYKTVDGGANFTKITFHKFIDIEFKPGNVNIMYGSTNQTAETWGCGIYRSDDGGGNWDLIYTDWEAARAELAVTPDEPDWVYSVICQRDGGLHGIFRSTDSGASYTMQFNGDIAGHNLLGWRCAADDSTGQGHYDLDIVVNPYVAEEVYIGGVNTWKSADAGVNWEITNVWIGDCNGAGVPTVHADKHHLVFRPGTTDLYECNDGGLYESTNYGWTWTDLSNGLVIGQVYRMSTAQTVPQEIINGYQDVGSKLLSGGTWDEVGGGDGQHCIIDPTNENIQYCSTPGGRVYRTTNHWASQTYITGNVLQVDTGWGIAPYKLDPNNHNTIYMGFGNFWRSTNKGDNWTKLADFPPEMESMRNLDIAPSNSNHMILANFDTLYRSTDGGYHWTSLTNNLPEAIREHLFMNIRFKHDDPNTFWLALASYDTHGVYQTTDGGTTWTNISAGLPSVPVECIVENQLVSSYSELYCATAAGVFVKLGEQPWLPFRQGMPRVYTKWLDIYYDGVNSKIRCGSYGRGTWESDLYSVETGAPGIWTGLESDDWFNINNWNYRQLPDAASDVTIPAGCPNYPQVTGSTAHLHTLTIVDGASLTIGNAIVEIEEDADIYGTLTMNHDAGVLRVKRDIIWENGSYANIQANAATIEVYDDWHHESGANVALTKGAVVFTDDFYFSHLYVTGGTLEFNILTVNKSNNKSLNFSPASTGGFKVNSLFQINAGSEYLHSAPFNLVLDGQFINNGTYKFLDGEFEFRGGNCTISGNSNCYFNDLTINSDAAYFELASDTWINGNLYIIDGSLAPQTVILHIGGDWNNQVGESGFIQGLSIVMFDGTSLQTFSSSELFYTLTLNKSSSEIVIANCTIECDNYNWASGTLQVNDGGTFIAQDLSDNYIAGNWVLNAGGNIELHSSSLVCLGGSITINGGDFHVYGGTTPSYWPWNNDVNLTMSDGHLVFFDQGITILDNANTFTSDISGGQITINGGFHAAIPGFDPDGGSVKLVGTDPVSISMHPGSTFNDLIISKQSSADSGSGNPPQIKPQASRISQPEPGTKSKYYPNQGSRSASVTASSDFFVVEEFRLIAGDFDVGPYHINVGYDARIYGNLIMNDAGGHFDVDQSIFWNSGSTANITEGEISFEEDYQVLDGADVILASNNILIADGVLPQLILMGDEAAEIRDLVVENTSDTLNFYIPGEGVIHIADSMMMNSNTSVVLNDSLSVGAALVIQNGAYLNVSGHNLLCNGDLQTAGTIDLGPGDIRVMDDFSMLSGGEINIDGGEIFLDRPYSGSFFPVSGTLNVDNGLFQATYDGISFESGGELNLQTMGTLKTGWTFKAVHSGNMAAMDGWIEMTGDNAANVWTDNGNELFSLRINKSPGVTIAILEPLTVNGDMEINSGILDANGYEILVGGDWNNNIGSGAFIEGTSYVDFIGPGVSTINTSELFYELIIEKTGPGARVEVPSNISVSSSYATSIWDGYLNLDANAHLNLNDLNIMAGGGLICDTISNSFITLTGDWNNYNTNFTDSTGFRYGKSTVTFLGSSKQALTSSSAGGERLYDMVINKSAGAFTSADWIRINGNCVIEEGDWNTGATGPYFYFYNDFIIESGGHFKDQTAGLIFSGPGYHLINTSVGGTLVINKLIVDLDFSDPSNYAIMTGDIHCLDQASIKDGEFKLNSKTLLVDNILEVRTGGRLSGLFNSEIQMAENASIYVKEGVLQLEGTETQPCKITNQGSGYFAFNVESGGYFSATHTMIEYVETDGVNFYNNGLADSTSGFQGCTFGNGKPGGCLMQFSTGQVVEFRDIVFPDDPSTGNTNVKKTSDAGEITILNAAGLLTGPDYEDDIYNRVHWTQMWTGTISSDWFTTGNWSMNQVPDAAINAYIPAGTPHDPVINIDIAHSRTFEIENGATLTISAGKELHINKDATICGHLTLSTNELLEVEGNLDWGAGSEVASGANSIIRVFGDMTIEHGSDLNLNAGTIEFTGTDPSSLICHEDSAALYNLDINKSSGVIFSLSATSTKDLLIKNNLYNQAGNQIHGVSPTTLEIGGAYINEGGNLYCGNTHLLLSGFSGSDSLKMNSGDYFADLTIKSLSIIQLSDAYSSMFNVRGDFLIDTCESGTPGISANGVYMLMEGDWENRAGDDAFIHGNNTVEFFNTLYKQIRGQNTFYELYEMTMGGGQIQIYGHQHVDSVFTIKHRVFVFDTLDCSRTLDLFQPNAEIRILGSDAKVDIDTLRQGGYFKVYGGSTEILDLHEDYLAGNYEMYGGLLDIHQDISSSIDLMADITMEGGYLSVYGGNGDSYWPAQMGGNFPTVTITNGTIDFIDRGIRIEGEPFMNYNITTNITGGTIRTAGDFLCQGAGTNFNPVGGTVEMYGSSSSYCRMMNGNSFWDLHTAKTGSAEVYNSFGINVRNQLIIQSGTFRESGYPVDVGPQ